MGFKGEYLNKFDDSGRISLPAKMRDELRTNNLGDSLVAYYTPQSKCLKLMTKQAFEKVENIHLSNPPTDKRTVDSYRYIFASSMDVEINGSGRITITPKHREKANLYDECYIIGVNDQIQIWNKEEWEKESARIEAEIFDDVSSPISSHLLF